MESVKNKIKLNIGGTDYTITSDDDYNYVASIGNDVDKKIKSILDKNPKIPITMASTLAALEYCDLENKAKARGTFLKDNLKNLTNEISHIKNLYENSISEIKYLKSKLEEMNLKVKFTNELQVQCKKYENELLALQEKYNDSCSTIKNFENTVSELNLNNKKELEKLNLEKQKLYDDLKSESLEYKNKIKNLEKEIEKQKLQKPISEIISYSISKSEIVDSDIDVLQPVCR